MPGRVHPARGQIRVVRPGDGGQRSLLREIFSILVTALILTLVIRTFLFTTFLVEGDSMAETLHDGDRVLVNRFIYHLRQPEREELVVFRLKEDDPETLVKRIIAIAGELVEIKQGVLYVNGVPAPEEYVGYHDLEDLSPVKVPPGGVFVMGDNRPRSSDSRNFGPVRLDQIQGKVLLVFWPPESFSIPEVNRDAPIDP